MKHRQITKARKRVLDYASLHDTITLKQACEIGGWSQGWYNLNILVRAGLMRHDGHGIWRATCMWNHQKRKWEPWPSWARSWWDIECYVSP
jgi:hypothetical protein